MSLAVLQLQLGQQIRRMRVVCVTYVGDDCSPKKQTSTNVGQSRVKFYY